MSTKNAAVEHKDATELDVAPDTVDTTPDTVDTTPDTVDESAANPGVLSRIWVVVSLALVVLVAAGAAVVTLYLRQDAALRAEAARGAAMEAAQQRLPQVLSYRYDTLDRDLATAEGAVTGRFREDYLQVQRTMVRPVAAQEHISTRTTVSALGVVRAQENEVVVLAFINQLTTSQKQATPRIDGARVRITLQRVGDTWLISQLETV